MIIAARRGRTRFVARGVPGEVLGEEVGACRQPAGAWTAASMRVGVTQWTLSPRAEGNAVDPADEWPGR